MIDPQRLVTLATLVLGSMAAADTMSIVADRDNTLFQSQTGGISSGSGSSLYAGRINFEVNNDWERRAIMRFDVSAIPAGSKIIEASVQVSVTRSPPQPPQNVPFELHRCNQAWGEGGSSASGGSGAPSQIDDATWFHSFYPDSDWSTPGGDFEAVQSGSVLINSNGNYVFTGAGLAADVQSWADGAENHGWIMTADVSEPRTVRQFASRESSVASARPTLVVVFEEGGIPGDFNGDGNVDGADFGLLLGTWGPCSGCPEDMNGDGFVNGLDIGLLLAAWTG